MPLFNIQEDDSDAYAAIAGGRERLSGWMQPAQRQRQKYPARLRRASDRFHEFTDFLSTLPTRACPREAADARASYRTGIPSGGSP